MLTQVADGVLVHESEFLRSGSVVVRGSSGVLLIDPGITRSEMANLAADIRALGETVVAGFSTHPHWDHVLWHPDLGDAPRYATAIGAAAMQTLLAGAGWRDRVARVLPPEHAAAIPLDRFGLTTALPEGATHIPWDGPPVRVVEHRAHTRGHAALVVEHSGVLVAGDMLSDILMPFLDLDASDPVGDYLDALTLIETAAVGVDAVVPGHGGVADAAGLRRRIELDRAYVLALRDGLVADDPRIGPSAPLGWLTDVHERQLQRLAEKSAHAEAPAQE